MLTALGIIGLIAFGVVLGRYPDMIWRHSRLLLSGPKLLWFWLFERMKRNPAIFGAYFSGFFTCLLVCGRLSELLWNISLVGLLIFGLLIFFPTIGGKIVLAVLNSSRFCAAKVKDFFA